MFQKLQSLKLCYLKSEYKSLEELSNVQELNKHVSETDDKEKQEIPIFLLNNASSCELFPSLKNTKGAFFCPN